MTPEQKGAPLVITMHWCATCGSLYSHNVGTGHIRQSGRGGRCDNPLTAVQYQQIGIQ